MSPTCSRADHRMSRFDAVWLDAGGVLVLPDPTVLGPLLAYYGGSTDLDRHRRAHYAAMAVKSAQGAQEMDWRDYDRVYVASLGVPLDDVEEAAALLGHTRTAALWRWPIADSLAALRALDAAAVPLESCPRLRADRARPAALRRVPGRTGCRGQRALRRRQPRRGSRQARPGDLRPRRGPLRRRRSGPRRLCR